jgi:hypothetical protein
MTTNESAIVNGARRLAISESVTRVSSITLSLTKKFPLFNIVVSVDSIRRSVF